MEIIWEYKKKRLDFGRHPQFEMSESFVLLDQKPNPSEAKQFIKLSPSSQGVQGTPKYSFKDVNTAIKDFKNVGMQHLEGGWPLDVDPSKIDQKQRYQRRVEKEDRYTKTLVQMTDQSDHFVKQNNALNIYESYFEGDEADDHRAPIEMCTQTPSVTVLTIFKDMEKDHKRTIADMSWHPTDGQKLAVAYSVPQYEEVPQGMNINSYIWDVNNPNKPASELIPMSPLTCIEYNPKETPLLIGGAHNGTLFVFDTRRGAHSVDYSHMKDSHNDPVYAVKWIQSKLNNEVVSVSIDGKMLFWDIRNLGKPMENFNLEITATNKGYTGLMGGMSLNYDTSYSTSKFLIGTEQGIAVSFNRKSKKQDKIEKTYFGHHGPIYSVQRNLFFNKYFLSVGDWTARIYNEELKTPIMETRYEASYLTDGCWSPSRPGVFFTTKQNGTLDVWDFLHNHEKPLVSVKLSDKALTNVSVFNGKHLACGSSDGSVHYLELSSDLSNFIGDSKQSIESEKNMILDMFEREFKREKTLEADRLKSEAARKRLKKQAEELQEKKIAEQQKKEERYEMENKLIAQWTDDYLTQTSTGDEDKQNGGESVTDQ